MKNIQNKFKIFSEYFKSVIKKRQNKQKENEIPLRYLYRWAHLRVFLFFTFLALTLVIIILFSFHILIKEENILAKTNIIVACIATLFGLCYELMRYITNCSKNQLEIKRVIYDLNNSEKEKQFEELFRQLKNENIYIIRNKIKKNKKPVNLFEGAEDIYDFLKRWNLNSSKNEKGNLVQVHIKNIDKKYSYVIQYAKSKFKIYPQETKRFLLRASKINFKITKMKKGSMREVLDGN